MGAWLSPHLTGVRGCDWGGGVKMVWLRFSTVVPRTAAARWAAAGRPNWNLLLPPEKMQQKLWENEEFFFYYYSFFFLENEEMRDGTRACYL